MPHTLVLILLLLAAAVVVVIACRLLRLPPLLGYLVVGIVVGPHAMSWVPDNAAVRDLAEFGIVFLMFSIGLEFSLPQLKAMSRAVFGFGLAQVAITTVMSMVALHFMNYGWLAGFALGGSLAMSSTAIVSKLLAERSELGTPHGRDVMAVLLFQDLAVVAFLIATPTLADGGTDLWRALALAAAKAAIALAVILFFGQKPMRAWFTLIARLRSPELFMLNVLLVTLGLAAATELAGLSYALGAFLAGMLIAETEYRYQVEEDIKPFRDVLLGLFFVTVGMYLDLHVVGAKLGWVLLLLIIPMLAKVALVVALARLFRRPAGHGAAHRLLPWADGRIRHRAVGARQRSEHRRPDAGAAGARRHGAVDACRTFRHPVFRAGGAPAHGQRLAGAGSAGDADRRKHDGAARPHHHLRLRTQRAKSRAPARGRTISRTSRSTPIRNVCARPRTVRVWSTAMRGGAKR